MATCSNCGNQKLLLSRRQCISCGQQGCVRCVHVFGWTDPPEFKVAHFVCSAACFDRWAWSVVQTNRLGVSGPDWFIAGVKIDGAYVTRLRGIDEENTRRQRLAHATNLVDAARHEDAAKIYESIGMWKEAGETRRQGLRQTVTQVHVNLNDMIEQLRRAGLSANYVCPTCRSPYRISADTPTDALRSCAYCGSVIRPTDLVDAITRVVGAR